MTNDNRDIRVAEIMRKDIVLVDGMETVDKALRAMVDKGLDVVFVNKRTDGDEFGMLSLSAVVNDVLAQNRRAQRLNVYEIMLKPVISVRSDMKIRYCARLFANAGIHAAPVIEDGKIIGLVTHAHLAAGFVAAESD